MFKGEVERDKGEENGSVVSRVAGAQHEMCPFQQL